jgi:outer membrane protein assembly factor BamB/predicted MPP superfamily phosphohydrolase
MKKNTILIALFTIVLLSIVDYSAKAQNVKIKFAHVADIHIGNAMANEDLERTVKDLNSMTDLDFVILAGDITEFGSDAELTEAKNLLDKLNKPWYIVPGNHDSKWSESGCNSFVRIFGSESYVFEKKGILFIGTPSGPNMRMGDGLIPREYIVFIDSVLKNLPNPQIPIVFVNHYPLDNSLSNYYLIIDMLKTRNIQVSLLGHGHANKLFDFEGIPGVMGRSNLRAQKDTGGYNLVTIKNDSIYFAERTPGIKTDSVWCKIAIQKHDFLSDKKPYPRPDYTMNQQFLQVKEIWKFTDDSDIGSGITAKDQYAIYANTRGAIVAINPKNGKILWKYQTGGKIYSTPAIANNKVVCPSTDKNIYCLNLKNGKSEWIFKTEKSIVASPVISGDTIFTGSSDGIFRSISLKDGKLLWQFDSVANFVEARPLIYKNAVYFGSWGNAFYALARKDGKLLWKRTKYNNRMLSPAAVFPVSAHDKIFIVAPDRHLTALNSATGYEIWDSSEYSCRESIGISNDHELVYIKTMKEGNLAAFFTNEPTQKLAWICQTGMGYEIAPSPVVENEHLIFMPTQTGVICAINKKTHQLIWKHKLSDSIINNIFILSQNSILLTTMDGTVACLKFSSNN